MDSQEQLSRAISEIQAGRIDKARAILARLVQHDPTNPDAWLVLSACLEDREKKEFCLNKVLSLDPGNPDALQELAELNGLDQIGQEQVTAEEVEAAAAAEIYEETAPETAQPEPWEQVEAFEQVPAFTEESMEELMGEGYDWETVADQTEAVEPPAPASSALDPWDIPFTGQVPIIETAAKPREPEPWELTPGPDEKEVAAIEKRAKRETARPKPVGKKMSWYEVWLMAVFSPSVGTYRRIIEDPAASPGRGYLWVFISGLISIFASTLIFAWRMQVMMPEFTAQFPGLASLNQQTILGYGLIGMLVGSPILAGIAVLGVIIQAALFQLVAKIFIGEGSFAEMVYALSAIAAPIYLLGIVFMLPIYWLNILGSLLGLYNLFLTLLAIKAVNRFGWGSSCVVVIAIPILMGICSCLFFLLLGPVLGTGVENFLPTNLIPGNMVVP